MLKYCAQLMGVFSGMLEWAVLIDVTSRLGGLFTWEYLSCCCKIEDDEGGVEIP